METNLVLSIDSCCSNHCATAPSPVTCHCNTSMSLQDSPRSQRSDQSTSVVKPAITLPQANDSEDRVIVPVSALEMAMRHCERFLKVKSHQDIDHGTTVSKVSIACCAYLITQPTLWLYLSVIVGLSLSICLSDSLVLSFSLSFCLISLCLSAPTLPLYPAPLFIHSLSLPPLPPPSLCPLPLFTPSLSLPLLASAPFLSLPTPLPFTPFSFTIAKIAVQSTKLYMSSRQGNHWLFESPYIYHLCVAHPIKIYVNFVLKTCCSH